MENLVEILGSIAIAVISLALIVIMFLFNYMQEISAWQRKRKNKKAR